MKRFSRVLFVAAAVAALPGAALAGGDHHRGRRAECRAAFEATHLPVYDSNRDGMLDRAERQAFRQDRRRQAMARYDADRDGQLSEVEWMKMRRDRVAQKFGRFDRNRDGFITRGEASLPCSRLARRFDRVDADRDGRITIAELGAVKMFGKHGKRRFSRPPRGFEQEPFGEPEASRRSSRSRSPRRSRKPSRSRSPRLPRLGHLRTGCRSATSHAPKMKRGTPADCAGVPRRTSHQSGLVLVDE